MAINLRGIEQRATSAINNVTNVATGVVENTIRDIDVILRRTGDCIRAQGEIAQRVGARAIEYQSATIRLLTEIGTIPLELILDVVENLGASIRRDPNPRIFRLVNPFGYVHGNEAADVRQIDANTINLPPNRWPLVFVHGASIFNGDLVQRALGFYDEFESAARMMNPVNPATSPDYRNNADVYLVSYDARLLNTDRSRFRMAFSRVLRDVVTDLTDILFYAVYWREMERRAAVTAERALLPFFNRMSGINFRISRLVSHSLGCYVVATAADRFMRTNTADPNGLFTSWFCMAPALPSGAFANTGEFEFAPRISPAPDDLPFGTSVWWNPIDEVFPAYNMATGNLAMGQTGALLSRFAVTDFVTTRYVGTVHEVSLANPNENYFSLLSPVLQNTLRTGALPNPIGARMKGSKAKKMRKSSQQANRKNRKSSSGNKKNIRLKQRVKKDDEE